MPMPWKGVRVATTVRLPVTVHAAAAAKARQLRWPLGEYVAWCVERSSTATPMVESVRNRPHPAMAPIPVPELDDE